MKKYSVKQVVKMEKRYEKLKDKDSAEYASFMGTLSTCAFGMGVILASFVTKDASAVQNAMANLSAIGFAVAGSGMFMDMVTAHFRKGRLENKLSEIYAQNNDSFEYEVYAERNGKTR